MKPPICYFDGKATLGLKAILHADALRHAAGWADRIAGKRPVIPLLAAALIEAGEQVTVKAFDYETSVKVAYTGQVITAGTVAVSARLLHQVAEAVRGQVEMVHDGAQLVVTAGRARWTLPTLPAEDFPRLPEPGPGAACEVPGAAFAAAVDTAASAAGNVDTINRVVLEPTADGLLVVGTDGYRVLMLTVPWVCSPVALPRTVDLPPPAALAVSRIGREAETVALGFPHAPAGEFGGGILAVEAGNVTITSRLLDDRRLKYGRLLDHARRNTGPVATVEVAALLATVEQAGIFALGCPIRLLANSDEIAVSGGSNDEGAAECEPVPAETIGPPDNSWSYRIDVNPAFMAHSLKSLRCGQARIRFHENPNLAMLLEQASDGAPYTAQTILMPIRLPGE